MEKQMENEMETGIISGITGVIILNLDWTFVCGLRPLVLLLL